MTGLKDEPLAYWPNVARLNSGLFASAVYFAMAAASPVMNAFRS